MSWGRKEKKRGYLFNTLGDFEASQDHLFRPGKKERKRRREGERQGKRERGSKQIEFILQNKGLRSVCDIFK